ASSRQPLRVHMYYFSQSLHKYAAYAMMSARLSRIDSRTFSRRRARSPAERSLRSASEGSNGRKIESTVRATGGTPGRTDRPGRSVLPEVVGSVLEDDVDAALAVARVEEALHHRVVLGRLLVVARARCRDD